MNNIPGVITSIESSEQISLVEVNVDGDIFSSIVLERPEENDLLKVGTPVELIFKETEVSIAKGLSGMISLRNRFSGKIVSLRQDKILTQVEFDYRGQKVVSIISTASARRMDMNPGDNVEWLVKTSEVALRFIKGRK